MTTENFIAEGLEKIGCRDAEILLSGPPQALLGYVTLENSHNEPVFLQELAFSKSSSRSAVAIPKAGLTINSVLMGGEVRRQTLSISMHPSTAPGTYRSTVEIGGVKREISVVVQETLEIELVPSEIVFFGTKPGETCNKEVLLVNKGNIPVIVPTIKHNTTVDMDLICRNLAFALRKDKESGMQETLDVFIRGMKNDVASWATVTVREAGQLVQPGETLVLHLAFTLPKDIQPTWLYEGDIRIIDQLLSYKIVPAVPEPAPMPKPAASTITTTASSTPKPAAPVRPATPTANVPPPVKVVKKKS